MTVNRAEKVVDSIYYILEPHALFIRKGGDDEVRYFVAQEILEVLTWILLNVSLPFLTGVASSLLANRIKKKHADNELKAMMVSKPELEKLISEVQQMLKNLSLEKRPAKDKILIAQRNLAETLKANGWPSNTAESDAERIMTAILDQIWKDVSEGEQ